MTQPSAPGWMEGVHALLEYLDAAVSVDQAASGIHGRVTVGVIGCGWWTVELGDPVRTTFHERPLPDDARAATLIMSPSEAEQLLAGRRVGSGRVPGRPR